MRRWSGGAGRRCRWAKEEKKRDGKLQVYDFATTAMGTMIISNVVQADNGEGQQSGRSGGDQSPPCLLGRT